MKKLFYVLRDCDTQGQETDTDLTTEVHKQAKPLVNLLDNSEISKIVSSSYKRAINSIQTFSNFSGINIELSLALIERSFGEINSLYESIIGEKAFYNPNFTTNNGLTISLVLRQALLIIDNALKDEKNTSIFVSHGYLIDILLNNFANNFAYEDFLKFKRYDLIKIIYDNSKLKK
jgi:2,3-bisphosphoglycerate-dependent phosphoglycerate mutase